MNTYSINVNINSIINNELIDYLNNTESKNINEFINTLLQLGLSTYKHINNISKLHFSDGTINSDRLILDQVEKTIENNNKNFIPLINEMNNNINNIKCLFNKSTNKGVFGETLLKNIITDKFPEYMIKDTYNVQHSGDFHLYLNDIDETILIENKFYTTPIATKEINKLYYDLQYTGIKFGLFISMTSNISGKKNDIEWDISNENIVVFISNAADRTNNISIGILIIKTLISIFKENQYNLSLIEDFSLYSYTNIVHNIKSLNKLNTNIGKIKSNINKINLNINSQLSELYNSITILDNEYSQKMNELQFIINKEFKKINTNIQLCKLDDIHQLVNTIDNNNIRIIVNQLLSDLYSNNFNIDNNWKIYNKTKIIGEIILKKLYIHIHLENGLQLKNIKISNCSNIVDIIKNMSL